VTRSLAAEEYCSLTTTGRRTGRPHRIEIWFAAAADERDTIYLLAGGRERADWVQNLRAHPAVRVDIGDRAFTGTARVVEGDSEEPSARRLVYEKYRTRDELEGWRDTALPVAIDLVHEPGAHRSV
jgi:deazaflavin-dependent oxidoreductase (nitroreductase family)